MWLIRGPSWQEAVREHSYSGGARDKHADGGKNMLFILGISRNMQRAMDVCTCARWHTFVRAHFCVCQSETLQEIERIERHLEKTRNALNSVYSPEQHYHKAHSQERPSLTLSLLIKLPKKCSTLTKCHLFTGYTCIYTVCMLLLRWRKSHEGNES